MRRLLMATMTLALFGCATARNGTRSAALGEAGNTGLTLEGRVFATPGRNNGEALKQPYHVGECYRVMTKRTFWNGAATVAAALTGSSGVGSVAASDTIRARNVLAWTTVALGAFTALSSSLSSGYTGSFDEMGCTGYLTDFRKLQHEIFTADVDNFLKKYEQAFARNSEGDGSVGTGRPPEPGEEQKEVRAEEPKKVPGATE